MAVDLISSAFPGRTEYNKVDRTGYEPTEHTAHHSRASEPRYQKYIEFRNASDVTTDMVVGSLEDLRILSRGDV